MKRAFRQARVIARHRRYRRRRRSEQNRPQPVGGGLQDQHQHRAESDGFEIAGVADQPGQNVLQLIAQHRNSGGAENRAVDAARAAQHGHQQIFGAGADAERSRRNRALKMRVEPSRQSRQHRRVDEYHQLGGRSVDAERFCGARGAPQRSDGASNPAAEQILRGDHRKHHGDPHHHEIFAGVDQRVVADRKRRNASQSVMCAKPIQISEQIKERDAPRDGAERQIMS